MHLTPTHSSWINQVERLFAEVTRDPLRPPQHASTRKRPLRLGQYLEREPEAVDLD